MRPTVFESYTLPFFECQPLETATRITKANQSSHSSTGWACSNSMHYRDAAHGYGYDRAALAGMSGAETISPQTLRSRASDTCVIDASDAPLRHHQSHSQFTAIGKQDLPKIMLKTFPPMMGATEVQPQF